MEAVREDSTPEVEVEREVEGEGKGNAGKPASAPSEFDAWLEHYHQVTGRTSITGARPARDAFRARRKDGYSLGDLKAATVGCNADPWRREKGHNVPETILRPSNVEGYISQARDAGHATSDGTDRSKYNRNTEVIHV